MTEAGSLDIFKNRLAAPGPWARAQPIYVLPVALQIIHQIQMQKKINTLSLNVLSESRRKSAKESRTVRTSDTDIINAIRGPPTPLLGGGEY